MFEKSRAQSLDKNDERGSASRAGEATCEALPRSRLTQQFAFLDRR